MRVLHGPVNVGNQPWALSRAERELGLQSDLIVNYSTWLQYPSDRCISEYGNKSLKHRWRRMRFGLRAPFDYDVMHFYFGRTFLTWDDYGPPKRGWYRDLRVAKRLGRKCFMTLQGCDVRLSAESAERNRYTMCSEGNCGAAPTCRAELDARRRRLISDVLPQFDRTFVLNPELAQYVPGASFLPYAVDVRSSEQRAPKTDGVPVVLHAPSDEGVKGSRFVVEAIERLQKRMPIEFVKVQGLPHEEAMQLYGRADLVVDQVLAGWYGAFAVEVMAMGKPVACYIRDEDLGCIPESMRADMPFVRVTPDTIESDLEAALDRRSEWPEWGQRSLEYARKWHDPMRLAAAMKRAYEDSASRFELEAEMESSRCVG